MKIKELILNNKGLKLTAAILALTVWVLISGKERAYLEKNFRINIEHSNISEMADVQSRPETVRITVRGTTRIIERISENDFSINVDLADVKGSTRLTMYTEDLLKFPEGVEIISVNPKIFEVNIREFFLKEVAVRVLYTGRLQKGISLTERKINPERIRIFGYKSDLKNIETVYAAEKIDLSTVTESRVMNMPLEKREEILRYEGFDSIEVTLTVEDINEKNK